MLVAHFMKGHSLDDQVPLCVDLDGTLIRTDVLWEGIKYMLEA